jgi:hypothetical protein
VEVGRLCKTLVNFYQSTRRNNPEDGHLQVLFNFVFRMEVLSLGRVSSGIHFWLGTGSPCGYNTSPACSFLFSATIWHNSKKLHWSRHTNRINTCVLYCALLVCDMWKIGRSYWSNSDVLFVSRLKHHWNCVRLIFTHENISHSQSVLFETHSGYFNVTSVVR